MNKDEWEAKRLRNKSRDADQQNAQANYDQRKEHLNPVAADKRTAFQHGKGHGADLHDDGDVNMIVKFACRAENEELKERVFCVGTARMAEVSKVVVPSTWKLRL